ncbi:MAG: hypothetical protein J5601_01040 [Elusimicrobiaceae bacterium]|nr:hypothetical protein [Elusimicrobiaceae bacterium]
MLRYCFIDALLLVLFGGSMGVAFLCCVVVLLMLCWCLVVLFGAVCTCYTAWFYTRRCYGESFTRGGSSGQGT